MKKLLILSILLLASLIIKEQILHAQDEEVIAYFNTRKQCEEFSCWQKCRERGFWTGWCTCHENCRSNRPGSGCITGNGCHVCKCLR